LALLPACPAAVPWSLVLVLGAAFWSLVLGAVVLGLAWSLWLLWLDVEDPWLGNDDEEDPEVCAAATVTANTTASSSTSKALILVRMPIAPWPEWLKSSRETRGLRVFLGGWLRWLDETSCPRVGR
jgi:hypothetical protein